MIRKILIFLNQLLIIFNSSILILIMILSMTIGNKKYILFMLDKTNYYKEIYYDSLSFIEGETIQLGLEKNQIQKIITEKQVEKDIRNLINCIYDNKELEINKESLSLNLENLIQEKLKENNRVATEEELTAIKNLKNQIESGYENKIIYSKKYILKIRNYYHKMMQYSNKIIFLLFSLELFLISLLLFLNKKLTKFNKELGISFLSVSFLIFLVKILIQHKFQRISIFSRIFSKLVIAIINSLFQYLLIIGGILGIIGLMMIIIGVVGNYPKKKRG